jgi:hypothetical protein
MFLRVIPLISFALAWISEQAFSAYYFVLDFLNLTDTSAPMETIKDKLREYCATPWADVGEPSERRSAAMLVFLYSSLLEQCV